MTVDPQLLHGLPVFGSLPDDELRLLSEKMRPIALSAGELLFAEGDDCQKFYIVVKGEVDIVKALGTPDERLLAVRPAGTVVGELSLFSPGKRHTASVRAHSALELLEMTRADFDTLLARYPRLAYAMVQTLSLRLIESEQTTIRDLREKNEALALAYLQLQAAQAQLIEKERLERELQVARDIQCSMLCVTAPRRPGYDFGAVMEAMYAVGGDFYDFLSFDDGRVGLAVGDVSDHGVPAALFMSMSITLLRSAARREPTPADVLRAVNRGLLEFNTAGMFVTLLYGVLDLATGDFAYARAGHERPLLWTEEDGRHEPRATDFAPPAAGDASTPNAQPSAASRGQLLGVFDEPQLELGRLRLPPGGTLLLYTDGAREAWDPAGAMFGEAGLAAALQAGAAISAQAVCDGIFRQVATHRGPVPQQDDITLVAVKSSA